MLYKRYKKHMILQNLKTIGTFGDAIKSGVITVHVASNKQDQLAKQIR